ncbi:MAG TPA: 6-phosphogluconolactonase [Acidobacteriaceae bacterium]|nr:6-phosphogluconolactonase [Acidobacteriaceae bacterium]
MPRRVQVTYRVWPTPEEMAAAAAEEFVAAVNKAADARGVARVAISGGTTPQVTFAMLADRSKPYFARMPWEKLHLFWVDERTVPPDDKDSNYGMTKKAMLDHVPLPAAQVHRMEGELDPQQAAERYEETLRREFGLDRNGSGLDQNGNPVFDFLQLGMGDDGHCASLFPHTEALHEVGKIVTANHVPQMNTWRITLTWPVINKAREVSFWIEKTSKAEILHDVLQGKYDPESKPSQLIRPESGQLGFLLDAAAAAKLPRTVSDDEPEEEVYSGTLELE